MIMFIILLNGYLGHSQMEIIEKGDTVVFGEAENKIGSNYFYHTLKCEDSGVEGRYEVSKFEAINKFGVVRKIKIKSEKSVVIIDVWTKFGKLETYPFKSMNLEESLEKKEIIPVHGIPEFVNWYFDSNQKKVDEFLKRFKVLQQKKDNTFANVYDLLNEVREGY